VASACFLAAGNSKESTIGARNAAKVLIDSSGLPFKVGIERADDDAGVQRRIRMELDEVPSIECHNRTTLSDGDLENSVIGERLMGLAHIGQRHDIVTETAEGLSGW
jgi:hypothetical protein